MMTSVFSIDFCPPASVSPHRMFASELFKGFCWQGVGAVGALRLSQTQMQLKLSRSCWVGSCWPPAPSHPLCVWCASSTPEAGPCALGVVRSAMKLKVSWGKRCRLREVAGGWAALLPKQTWEHRSLYAAKCLNPCWHWSLKPLYIFFLISHGLKYLLELELKVRARRAVSRSVERRLGKG